MKRLLTLCLVYQEPHILLGFKKRGFGQGRWNGFGGKVLKGESIEQATRRELKEEAGLSIGDHLEKYGILEFTFENEPEWLEVHVFKTTHFSGEPLESEEMRPAWFHKEEIPYEEMWPDDRYWLPLLLAGQKFKGIFHFGDYNTILQKQIEEVPII